MSSIYLKVTIEITWRSQNFDFPAPAHTDIEF